MTQSHQPPSTPCPKPHPNFFLFLFLLRECIHLKQLPVRIEKTPREGHKQIQAQRVNHKRSKPEDSQSLPGCFETPVPNSHPQEDVTQVPDHGVGCHLCASGFLREE